MVKKTLVAYGTKYGATAEIAEKIGEVLRQAGLPTDVLPADHVHDLAGYQAVVLGSGVYMGKWRKEAAQFLKTNEQALAERPLWLFSSGPTDHGDPLELLNGWRLPEAQQAIADRIHPRDVAVFNGALKIDKLNFFEKWITQKMVKAPVGDFRNWDAVASWANTIANTLKEPDFALQT